MWIVKEVADCHVHGTFQLDRVISGSSVIALETHYALLSPPRTITHNMATRLLSVPAGRSFRRQGTNWVDPQPEKGLIELSFEDDLLHLCTSSADHAEAKLMAGWKNRTLNTSEDVSCTADAPSSS